MEGRLEQIGSDAVENEKLGPVYPARVRLSRAWIDVDGRKVALEPGLAATAMGLFARGCPDSAGEPLGGLVWAVRGQPIPPGRRFQVMTMSDVLYMDRQTRMARLLAEVGEEEARRNPSAIYPPLQEPDPTVGRFRDLYFAPLELKHAFWTGIDGNFPDFDVKKGWLNVGPSPELHLGGDVSDNIPEIIRMTKGIFFSARAAEIISKKDPEGVDLRSAKLALPNGTTLSYEMVGLKRVMDIINWAQAAVNMTYIDGANIWVMGVKGKRGVKPDVEDFIHIVSCGGPMFSIELIESLRDGGVRGAAFVNEANYKTSYNL